MKIMFMGTPDFAKISLETLVNNDFEVCAVLSQPDKPRGRKMEIVMPPVKEYALSENIPVFQPDSLKDGAISGLLDEFKPDVIVAVAYGKLLPEYVLNYPKFGCINVHGSLLPKYRGSAPVQWAVINGDKNTGVTTMFMNKGMDTGDILLQKNVEISFHETSGHLMDKMAYVGAELLVETLLKLEKGEIVSVKQDENEATHAPMLTKEMARIDFNKSALEIENLIYGMSPWPCAYFETEKGIIKVFEADISEKDLGKVPGEIVSCEKEFAIQTGKGVLFIKELQLQGKKRMNAGDFLRGNKFENGQVL